MKAGSTGVLLTALTSVPSTLPGICLHVNLDVWEKVGKQLKTYHAEHGSENVPNDAFSLHKIHNVLPWLFLTYFCIVSSVQSLSHV